MNEPIKSESLLHDACDIFIRNLIEGRTTGLRVDATPRDKSLPPMTIYVVMGIKERDIMNAAFDTLPKDPFKP